MYTELYFLCSLDMISTLPLKKTILGVAESTKELIPILLFIPALPGYKLRDHVQNLTVVYFIFCDRILPLFSGLP